MELTTCPNCGSPNSTVKQKKNKHKGVIISIIVFALIVVSALGIGISKKAKELTGILFKYGNSIFYNA